MFICLRKKEKKKYRFPNPTNKLISFPFALNPSQRSLVFLDGGFKFLCAHWQQVRSCQHTRKHPSPHRVHTSSIPSLGCMFAPSSSGNRTKEMLRYSKVGLGYTHRPTLQIGPWYFLWWVFVFPSDESSFSNWAQGIFCGPKWPDLKTGDFHGPGVPSLEVLCSKLCLQRHLVTNWWRAITVCCCGSWFP